MSKTLEDRLLIAKAELAKARPLGGDTLRSVYGALGERGIRSWSGAVGEVPPIFSAAVHDAHANLDKEVEEELRPYWHQRLAFAEAEFTRELHQGAWPPPGERTGPPISRRSVAAGPLAGRPPTQNRPVPQGE
jgi:hypothetical protein